MSEECLQQTYDQMYQTYCRIFDRLGLKYRAVLADTGNIGGSASHEFHVLADSGEDRIVYTDNGQYAANIELADALVPARARPAPAAMMQTVDTPGQHTIEEVGNFLRISPAQCLKTLVVKGDNGTLVALVLRGDHELNRIKAERLPGVARPLEFARAEVIRAQVGCGIGSLGPVKLGITVIADHGALAVADFVCGANSDGKHLTGVNWERDLPLPQAADLRNVVAGEPAPNGAGPLRIAQGIEVGHIFQLGTKYSKDMKTVCLDENGSARTLIMGCYGIGVSRIVAAAIEQNHDDWGIIWPDAIAPFTVSLIPINMHKSKRLQDAALKLYEELLAAGMETIMDDRKERPGVMFADAELIGIPHRLTLSDSGLDAGTVEYKFRREKDKQVVPIAGVIDYLQARVGAT